MKYLIIGAGGTGGNIGGFMAHAGKDVTFLVRGKTKEAMDKNGLTLHSGRLGTIHLPNIQTVDADHLEKMDVIFVCVKGYSLNAVIPIIQKACHKDSVVIPVLNIFGTGSKIQKDLPDNLVTDSCIYIAGFAEQPGVIHQQGQLFKVVFGTRDGKNNHPYLKEIEKDLLDSHIDGYLSPEILKDTYSKFAFVSPMAAAGAYYDAPVKDLMENKEMHETYLSLIQEAIAVGKAMQIPLEEDLLETVLHLSTQMAPDTTTSLQKDLQKGGQSEIAGLIFDVVTNAEQLGVSAPKYKMVADKFANQQID